MSETLDSVCELIVDCVNRTAPEDIDGEYLLVGTPAMRGNVIDLASARRVSAETFATWTRRLMPRAGDLLLAREAPVGPVVMIPEGGRIGAGQRTTHLRANPSRVHNRFLYYLLSAPETQDRLLNRAMGSTVAHLRVADLKSFELPPLPPVPEQQAIAEVLGAVDDKIAANTALAATVDSLLSTTFRRYLRENALHEEALDAISNVVLGGTPSRARADYWTDGTIPWLNSGAVNATRIVEPSELITSDALANSAAKLMPVGATLLAITGATLGQIARLELSAAGNQSIVGVWSDDIHLNAWLYFAIHARLDDLLARATGAAQQHVSKGDVEQLGVPIPSQTVLEEFSGVATPALELAALLERENRTLTATRDTLLPQLMSGKLRVRDAEAAASVAGV